MKYLKCAQCGKIDKPNRLQGFYNSGTANTMRCPDCSPFDADDYNATLCRACCPTGHKTRDNQDEND